jgi:uncharacterized protein (DUF2252 family)
MSKQGTAETLATTIAAEEERVAQLRGAPRGFVRDGWLPAREHAALGKAARKATPREQHAAWRPAPDRADPIALLRGQDADRVPQLVPIRWGRMSVSPFTFYRGAALAMAADLSTTPTSGLRVQLCGDAHLMNFGVFGAPDRSLIFDINDFDETLPGPWEWDVKRFAASVVIAARDREFTTAEGRDAALAAACSYRTWMARYAGMDNRSVWYSRVTADDALALVKETAGARKKTTAKMLAKARAHDNLQAFDKLTTVIDGVPRFVDRPPLLAHLTPEQADLASAGRRAFADYRRTLSDEWRTLLDRYAFVDLAFKVVGVGSVGTRDLVVLLMGRDDGDPLILQLKEAKPSVLEAYAGRSRYSNHGHRVVAGQRLMQAASDTFLGWIRGTGPVRRDLYWRQLHDLKGSIPADRVRPAGLCMYAGLCGWTLARAHARSGDRMAIAAYLGTSDQFDRAIADFAEAYADQAERDFELLTKAIKRGEIKVETGV